MSNKKEIEEFKKQIDQEKEKPDKINVKYLSRPLWQYKRLRLSRAKDKTRTLADIYRSLCSFHEELIDTIDEVSQHFYESVDSLEEPLVIYFPEDRQKVTIRPSTDNDWPPYSISIEKITTNKEWQVAIEQYKELKKSDFEE